MASDSTVSDGKIFNIIQPQWVHFSNPHKVLVDVGGSLTMLSCLLVSSKGQKSVSGKIKTSNMQQAFYNFGSLCQTLLAKKKQWKNALFSLVRLLV